MAIGAFVGEWVGAVPSPLQFLSLRTDVNPILDTTDRTWVKLLRRAVVESPATVWFSPIADLARGVTGGYQAHARFPIVGSDDTALVAAAREHGFSGSFAASTLSAMLGRREELPANAFLSVEVDVAALVAPEVVAVLGAATDLSAVVFELTGFDSFTDHAAVLQALRPARARGALVAIQGTGNLDVLGLVDLAPEFVKLGGDLIRGIDSHPRHAAAVAGIGNLAGQLDAWLIADGVSTMSEVERLRELGVPLAQGPLVGGESELMMGMPSAARHLLRSWAAERPDQLTALSTAVRTVTVRPQLASETTVLVDSQGRPLEVIIPSGRRTACHPAMTVQRSDRIRDVALRATSRPVEDELAPICLCDELGHLAGLIRVPALLEALARSI